METQKKNLIRYSYPSLLIIGDREIDKWGIQISWPTIKFARCEITKRFDFYIDGPSIIRVLGGKDDFAIGLSLLGFGLSVSYVNK